MAWLRRSVPGSPASSATDTAPALSSEPSPKGSTRKALVSVAGRLERAKLSGRADAAPPPRPRTARPAKPGASAGGASAPDPAEPSFQQSPSSPSRMLHHSFHLRPGLLVSIDLPEDVTATEVARFSSFLDAIPFAGGSRH